MVYSLGPVARAAGYRLATFKSIDSTSSEAMRRGQTGDFGRLWIVADEQTAGHGRRGSAWRTLPGNLSTSLLMPVEGGGAATATLGFAAGLALGAAIRATASRTGAPSPLGGEGGSRSDPGEVEPRDHAPSVLRRAPPLPTLSQAKGPPSPSRGEGSGATSHLQLKWPNDVLLDGGKVAGILLEAVNAPSGQHGVVIGIGVNVRHVPSELHTRAASLASSGIETTAEALFAALADAWVEPASLWNAGRGFPVIRERWLAHAAGLGAPIAVRMGGDVIRGTFETIDDTGRLVVREGGGAIRPVSAGDVFFGDAATAVT